MQKMAANSLSQPPDLPSMPWYRRTDLEPSSEDDLEESEQEPLRSQREGFLELQLLHPNQND